MSTNSERLEEFRKAKLLYDQMMDKTVICRRNMEKLLQYEDSELCKFLMERDIMEKLQFANVDEIGKVLADSLENVDAVDTKLSAPLNARSRKRQNQNVDDDNDEIDEGYNAIDSLNVMLNEMRAKKQ